MCGGVYDWSVAHHPQDLPLDRAAKELRADDLFLTLLRRFTAENRKVYESSGKAYAPALFAREDEAERRGCQQGVRCRHAPTIQD